MKVFAILAFLVTICEALQDVYYSIEQKRDEKNIALTFDDGPHRYLTPKLLDVLKERKAKATFFVMGVKAITHPSIIKRAFNEGHEIANHVWDHPVLPKIPEAVLSEQLGKTNKAIYAAIDAMPQVMRPPYGNTNAKLNKNIAKNYNMTVIMWSYDTNDWKRPKSKDIVKYAIPQLKSGTVILCHDIHPGTVAAIPSLIDEAMENGFNFSTISHMISNAKK